MVAEFLESETHPAGPAHPTRPLAETEGRLATFPPLVFAGEARKLKKQLAAVSAAASSEGNCAASFAEHGADNIRDFFRVFLQIAVDGHSPVRSRW